MKKRKLLILLFSALATVVFAIPVAFGIAVSLPKTCYVSLVSEGQKIYTITAKEGDELDLSRYVAQKEPTTERLYEHVGYSTDDSQTLYAETDSLEGKNIISGSYKVTGDTTLYAVFQEKSYYYLVSFIDEVTGQKIVEDQLVLRGTDATIPQAPEHIGYTFTGWQGNSTNIKGKTIIVATYLANKHTVTYNYLGKQKTAEISFNQTLDLAIDFGVPSSVAVDGIFYDQDYTQRVNVGDKLSVDQDINLYVKLHIDTSALALSYVGDNVYGDDEYLLAVGQDSDVNYTYLWNSGEITARLDLRACGTAEHSVTISASYLGLSASTTLSKTVTINKAELSVSVSLAKQQFGYGENVNPTIVLDGAKYNDEQILRGQFGYDILSGAQVVTGYLSQGHYFVRLVLPSELDNYTLVGQSGAEFDVIKATLTITVTAKDVTYGSAVKPSVVSATGLGYGDRLDNLGAISFSVTKSGKTYALGHLDVGTYQLSASMAELENYNVVFRCGQVTVNKALLTVYVAENTITYGDIPEFALVADGLKNKDNISVLTGEPQFAVSLASLNQNANRLNAGTYNVSVSGLSASNYTITYKDSSLVVLPKDLTISVILPQNQINYADNIGASLQFSGFAFDDTQSVITNAGIQYYKADSAIDDEILPVGTYRVSAKYDKNSNYNISVIENSLTINKLVLTLDNGTATNIGRSSAANWNYDVQLDDERFVATGTVKLKDNNSGTKSATTLDQFEQYFVWQTAFSVKHNGAEVTNNFELAYNLSVVVNNSSFSITVPEQKNITYDTDAHDFSISVVAEDSSLDGGEEYNVDYIVTKDGENFEGVNFTDAGTYIVKYTVSAKNYTDISGEYTIVISKAQGTIDTSKLVTNYTYNGTEQKIDLSKITFVGDGELSFAGTQSLTNVTDADNPLVITLSEGKNYLGKTVQVNFVMQGAQFEVVTPQVSESTYTGSATDYSLDVSAEYHDEEPTIIYTIYRNNQKTELTTPNLVMAGNYKIDYVITGSKNYQQKTGSYNITIDKANITEKITHQDIAEPLTLTYNLSLADTGISLGDNFRWQTPTELVKAGTNKYKICYNTDTENYNDVVLEISVTANKKQISVSVEEANLEQDFGVKAIDNAWFGYNIEAQSLSDAEREYLKNAIKLSLSHKIDLNVGSTYAVDYAFSLPDDNWYTLTGTINFTKAFKLKSVLYNGTYYTLEDAINQASSGTIIVANNTSTITDADKQKLGIYNSDAYYTLKNSVTLLVPYSSKHSTSITDCSTTFTAITHQKGYVNLTLTTGTTIVASTGSKIIVNAERYIGSNHTSIVNGNNYGVLTLMADSVVTVASGAEFDCIGFAVGDGQIDATSGSSVKEPFNMVGWKGGSISSGVKDNVFPLNQYNLASIEAKIKISSGADYQVVAGLVASSMQVSDMFIKFAGNSKSYFLQVTSGYFTKSVDKTTGNVVVDVNGDITFNNLELSYTIVFFFLPMTYTFTTEKLDIPIPGNFKISISGGTATVPSNVSMKLLPGAALNINKDATLVVNGKVYSYGASNKTFDNSLTQFKDGNNNLAYPCTQMPNCYYYTPKFDYSASTPATFAIEGKVVVNSNAIFAAQVTGKSGGRLEIASDAILNSSITEDYSSYANGSAKTAYFHTTLVAKFADDTAVEAGNYKFDGSAWNKE